MGSVLYHNAFKYVSQNQTVKNELGHSLSMMNCNGKFYPLYNSCEFNLVLFGDQAKGRVNVKAQKNSNN